VLANRRVVLVVKLLSFFFLFGGVMCVLTILLLSYPGSFLEPMWRLNPEAQRSFQSIGGWAIPLMGVVGVACLLSAIGLAMRTNWGRRFAIAVLAVNLLGDTIAALVRHDPRSLVGLPIGGAMIAFLMSARVRFLFGGAGSDAS
jgi:hypothetical protein